MSATSKNEVRTQKKVEEALRSKMKESAVQQCRPTLAAFADCARGRLFSVIWACRPQARAMNECLKQYTSDEALDELKRKYLLEQEQKRQASGAGL